MRPLPVHDAHKVDCPYCYGNGCMPCLGRGWVETAEGREEREAAEDDRADAMLHDRAERDLE